MHDKIDNVSPNKKLVSIFSDEDYRPFLNWSFSQPLSQNNHRAVPLSTAANQLKMDASLLSRVLKGERALTLDQAYLVSEYLSLNEYESEYLMALVNLERAGNLNLKERLRGQLVKIRREYDLTAQPESESAVLSNINQFKFYSSWHYSAVRLLTALPRYQEQYAAKLISVHLGIPEKLVNEILEFLLSTGLCSKLPNGQVVRAKKDTIIDRNSPMIDRHLLNWRIRACEQLPYSGSLDLFHSSPILISENTAKDIKSKLRELIKLIQTLSHEDGDKVPFCLNVDWFSF